jgi:dolichyl-phosphate-mannose--protein O-mannosyl transferase
VSTSSAPAPEVGHGVGRRASLSRTARGTVVPSAVRRTRTRLLRTDPVIDWVVTLAVAFLALFLRLWDIGFPKAFLFDETYYAKDAWSLIHNGYVTNYVDKANGEILAGHVSGLFEKTPEMIVHPNLGRWLIGAGEALFGMDPTGWRIPSAVVGALMVLVMVRLARRVTGSMLLGAVAGLLMCFDGLQFVLSRLALLDIFVAFFTLCAISCLVADRDWGRAKLARLLPEGTGLSAGSWGPRLWWRPWRLAAGVFWGLALGSKWDAIFPLAAFGLLVWFWDAGARRSFGVRGAVLKSALADAAPAVLYVVLLPLVVYLACWTSWMVHASVYEASLSRNQYGPYWGDYIKRPAHGFFAKAGKALRDLANYHRDVLAFHTNGLLDAHHVYQSKPQGWLILNRPVGVDAQLDIKPGEQGCAAAAGSTCLRQVLLIGTPALWWFGTIAFVWSGICWIGRRDWRYGVVTIGVLVTWLPWLRWDDRPIFSYYAMMIEPFLVLGATLLLGEMLGPATATARRRQVGAIAAGAVFVAVLLNFAWFWPIYTDGLLTTQQWLERIWFKRWI